MSFDLLDIDDIKRAIMAAANVNELERISMLATLTMRAADMFCETSLWEDLSSSIGLRLMEFCSTRLSVAVRTGEFLTETEFREQGFGNIFELFKTKLGELETAVAMQKELDDQFLAALPEKIREESTQLVRACLIQVRRGLLADAVNDLII